jgi:glycosyltransferase involved in cell wall biosynthesis
MNTNFKPMISVVIPCYNVAKYIEGCLESVLAQTFESFEVICVNDDSPDNTVEIIERFKDDRIRIIHQANRGLAGARNTGINASRGLYVALLDADDLWLPTKLETHFRHLQMNPKVGISYSASEFIDEGGHLMGIGQYPKCADITPKDIFCRNPIGNGSAPVIRKSLLNCISQLKTKGEETRREYFDEDMRQSEDVEFWLRAALSTDYLFEGINEALTLYRVNMSGLSANLDKQYESWLYSVKQNEKLDSTFVQNWFSLASAYQKRYLARRAIQSRNSRTACKLMKEALTQDIRILSEEPKRTLVTVFCAILCALPNTLYDAIEATGMRLSHRAAQS